MDLSNQVSGFYFDLVRTFPLRPIRAESELDEAIAILLRLSKSNVPEAMDAGERDYLEALTMLVQRFEQSRRNSTLPKLTPIDRLKFLMSEQGMNVSDLGCVIASQPNASLILPGKRAMSKTHILKILGILPSPRRYLRNKRAYKARRLPSAGLEV